MVFDASVRNWVTVVGGGGQEGARQDGLGTPIQALLALFYANDVMVAAPNSARLQGEFDALTVLFDRVGLSTNKLNTVSMASWTCRTPHAWSIEAYTWQVTGMRLSYRDRLLQQVYCLEFRLVLAARFLTDLCQKQYGVGCRESTPPPP